MGFSKPKAITPAPAPPPVTTSAPEVTRAEEEERRKQANRKGYDWTMNPGGGGKKSLLSAPNSVTPSADAAPSRTLLSAR